MCVCVFNCFYIYFSKCLESYLFWEKEKDIFFFGIIRRRGNFITLVILKIHVILCFFFFVIYITHCYKALSDMSAEIVSGPYKNINFFFLLTLIFLILQFFKFYLFELLRIYIFSLGRGKKKKRQYHCFFFFFSFSKFLF